MTPQEASAVPDSETGPIALAQLLAIHRIAIEPAHLRHALGHAGATSAEDLVRLARARMAAGLNGWRIRRCPRWPKGRMAGF